MRTIVGLAVVIGVIYGLHWVLKQVKSGREQRSTGGGLDSISTLQLAPGRSLHLVRSGSEIILVGSGEHGVTPIRVYSEEEARSLGLLDAEGPKPRDRHERDGDRPGPGAWRSRAVRADNPMNAAPGSPPKLRDLVKTVQRWTVRG